MRAGKKRLIKITCVIAILLFLCLILEVKIREQTQERVYYGEGKACEYWTDSLFSKTQNRDYAYAFVWVDDKKADFTWEFYDDKDSLVENFLEKKEDMLQEEKSGTAWSFLKLRLDEDIYGIDIYEYLEQNLSEEGYEYRAETFPNEEREIPDKESPYYIKQIQIEEHMEENFFYIWQKREVVINDGFMYFLTCEDGYEESKDTVTEQFWQFKFNDWFANERYGVAYFLDEEQLYWMKYTQRESRLENPECMFIEERANIIDDIYSEWQGYFGLLKEAEYRVQLAPTLPEMTIHFRYAKEAEEDGYEFYLLWNPETEEFRFMRRDIFLARQAEKNTNPDKEETDAEPQEMLYTLSFIVEDGDSLWKISEECYGDGRQWQKIYEYNQDAIGENPSLILPGVELEMP